MELTAEQAKSLLLHTTAGAMALEFAVKVLIASHHDRAALRAFWEREAPGLVDHALDDAVFSTFPAFQVALNGQMELFAELIASD